MERTGTVDLMFTNVLVIALAVAAYIGWRQIMGQLDDVSAAVAAARAELDADKADIIAEIQRLQVSQAEKDALIASVGEFGTALDDVPGVITEVVPAPEPEPEPAPEPV